MTNEQFIKKLTTNVVNNENARNPLFETIVNLEYSISEL
jgi:hypothetical protein